MNILLVNPSFPVTYWGYQYALRFSRASVLIPPLGLITVAAMLPDDWELRLHDLNIGPLDDSQIEWADTVFVGGMRVQAPSMHEVISRARALGRRVVVGGPAPTTSPSEFADADLIFQGEAEGRVDELITALEAPRGAIRLLSGDGERPAMTESPIPRFDLLDINAYDTMSIQYSRGCPYRCEFCDIIEIYGRIPRVKSSEQIVAEFEVLHGLGWRGAVFVVDDNFIGNRPAVRRMLPELQAFQEAHKYPFELTTEATVNLAQDDKLLTAMVSAGFTKVFVGIESASPDTLEAAQKSQNLKTDLLASVEKITAAGIEVMAGFIVGFDQDTAATFEQQRAFIQSAPIPIAMAGLLIALPGTQLWRRLTKEGRLRGSGNGDQFGRSNFDPVLDEEVLLEGYAKLLGDLYEPAAYFARCEATTLAAAPVPGASNVGIADIYRFFQLIWVVGIMRPWRRHFWRLLFRTLRRSPHNLRRAMVQAAVGEHMIQYTHRDMLPRLAQAVEDVRAERARAKQAMPPIAMSA